MLVQWSHRPEKDNWRNKYTVTTRHEILLLNVQVAHDMTATTMLSAAVGSKSCYKLHAAHSVWCIQVLMLLVQFFQGNDILRMVLVCQLLPFQAMQVA